MTTKDITTGTQTVTAVGAVTGTLDISGTAYKTANWTLFLVVQGALTGSTNSCRVTIQMTTNSFTNSQVLMHVDIEGGVSGNADKVYSTRLQDNPSAANYFGISGGTLRAYVDDIGSPNVVAVHAFLQY